MRLLHFGDQTLTIFQDDSLSSPFMTAVFKCLTTPVNGGFCHWLAFAMQLTLKHRQCGADSA
ncbi:hypothetical protein EBN15_11240 [Xanthomonas cucurbitae]|nr:hypothetical protein EBN15_11240 [Xanthomonas cucurbitae]